MRPTCSSKVDILLSHAASDFLIEATDLNNPTLIKGEFISGRQVRGTGCTYATAIACELTRTPDLEDAIRKARLYLSTTIRNAYEVTPGTLAARSLPCNDLKLS